MKNRSIVDRADKIVGANYELISTSSHEAGTPAHDANTDTIGAAEIAEESWSRLASPPGGGRSPRASLRILWTLIEMLELREGEGTTTAIWSSSCARF